MKALFAATAAIGLALSVPAMAQTVEITTEQQAMYDGWPAENQATYDAWPAEAQTYYWTLDDAQADVWWNMLNDEQRVRIVGMTPEQRMAAWTSINNQVNAATNATAGTTGTANASTTAQATSPAMSGNIQFKRSEMVQTLPASSASSSALVSGDLPVCKKDQQDGCINSWEKNKTGTRPLNYWPGKPASEIDGPIPANNPN